MGIYMICAGGIAEKQQCLRTARAVLSVSCNLRMYQSCPGTNWGKSSAPSVHLLPPWQHQLLGWVWLRRPWTQGILGERWGWDSKAPVLLFLFLSRSWRGLRNVSETRWGAAGLGAPCLAAISSSCYSDHKSRGAQLPL